MTEAFVLAQIFGLLALSVKVVGIQFKKKANILLLTIVSATLFTINYILLNAWSAAVICTVGAVVVLTIFLLEKRKKRKISWLIVLIFVALEIIPWAFFYQDWYDVLPLIGTLLWLTSMLQRDENRLRWFLIVNFIPWMIYGIITATYTAMLADVFSVTSTVIALIRYRKTTHV